MKITKNLLKQLIKEELKNIDEQQSQADLYRQAHHTSTANVALAREKYGGDAHESSMSAMMQAQIDLLTDVRDLLSQILNKGGM